MLTIVTVCFNNPEELEKTVASVSFQETQPDHYVVLDSSDNANAPRMRRIARGANARYEWVAPQGVYHGMRHSLSFVDKESWVWWLNSSDWLAGKKSVKAATEAITAAESSNFHWIVGELLRVQHPIPSVHDIGSSGDEFLRMLQTGKTGFPHPSTIFRNAALATVSPYEDRLAIASDYGTALRFAQKFGPPLLLTNSLAVHDPTGLTSRHPVQNLFERSRARISSGTAVSVVAEFWRLPRSAIRGLASRLAGEKPVQRIGERLATFPLRGNEPFPDEKNPDFRLNFEHSAPPQVAVLSLTDPDGNGRVARATQLLFQADMNPLVVSPKSMPEANYRLRLRGLFGSSGLGLSFNRFIARSLIWIGYLVGIDPLKSATFGGDVVLGFRRIKHVLAETPTHLLVEDILLLPAALSIKPKKIVIFDSRDLSHRLFDNRWFWKRTFGLAIRSVLAKSLPLCDHVFTVSQGLADQIQEDFSVKASVIRSLPNSDKMASKTDAKLPISVVYMGRADSNRELLKLVKALRSPTDAIVMHFFLVGHKFDIFRLRLASRKLSKTFFHDPVPFVDIIPTLSHYDLGYVACGEATLNIKKSLPNKLFEYLFAGLPVLVSEGTEMADFLKEFKAGIAIDTTRPDTIATALSKLSGARVADLADGVNHVQESLTWSEESQLLLSMFRRP